MASEFAKKLIKTHEGLRLKPYKCSSGKLTIGYGRNLDDRGISIEEAKELLENDLIDTEVSLIKIYGINILKIDEYRLAALMDMCFNLGEYGLRKFGKMNDAVNKGDWETVANEAKNSIWFNQVGMRGEKIVEILRKGAV